VCGGGAFGHDAGVDDVAPPRILLGNLEPIMLVGLRRVLADEGVDVVGEEHVLDRILSAAERLQPDVIVLDLDSARSGTLAEAARRAAPKAKLIFWARDETLIEVLDPASSDSRVIAIAAPTGLHRELTKQMTAMED
jgi:DNA-binding NarL/FixJ family response regulator